MMAFHIPIDMTRHIALMILFIILSFSSTAQTTFFVATNGSDTYDGSLTRPLKTLGAALERIATAPQGDVHINLRGGKYAQTKTIELTPMLLAGHKILLSSYRNEGVTITGALKITVDWKPY